MKKINGFVAVSLLSVALAACGTGADTDTEAGSETGTEQTDGTSDMMGGGSDEPNPNLGTATGQDLEEVDVKRTPTTQEPNDELTGADDLEDQESPPE